MVLLCHFWALDSPSFQSLLLYRPIYIYKKTAKLGSKEDWMTSGWVNNDWTHFCVRCSFKTSEESLESAEQVLCYYSSTWQFCDRLLTVNGGLLLLITCFMIVSVCRNYCWYQHIARKCVIFSVICGEAQGTISFHCLQSDVPENSWEWKKCLCCKKSVSH